MFSANAGGNTDTKKELGDNVKDRTYINGYSHLFKAIDTQIQFQNIVFKYTTSKQLKNV